MIPTFDGTDFRQYERRFRLFVSNTRVAPERRAGKLLERLEARAFDLCEGVQDLGTPNGVENLLDHLRTHVDPIEVSRRGRILDDFVYDFERQPGEEIRDYDTRFNILLRRFEAVVGQVNPLVKAHVFLRKAILSAEKQSQIVGATMSRYEYESLRDAMLVAIPRPGALRGGVPLHRKQAGAHSAEVVEAPEEEDKGEHVLAENEASGEESEAEYQETVAMLTIAKQRIARQSFENLSPLKSARPGSTSLSRNCKMWSTGTLERRQ